MTMMMMYCELECKEEEVSMACFKELSRYLQRGA